MKKNRKTVNISKKPTEPSQKIIVTNRKRENPVEDERSAKCNLKFVFDFVSESFMDIQDFADGL